MEAPVLSAERGTSDAETPVLEIRGLSKVFQVNGSRHAVLDGITFNAGRGELICLLGRSGCGKSREA
jgi:ABC-type glutathione transport system ATPase component